MNPNHTAVAPTGIKPMNLIGSSSGRIQALDGFRGASVLAIVFLHYVVHHLQFQPGTLPAYVRQYLLFLWTGVDAFFVLSGFLIGGILLEQRRTTNYFQVFYLRRSLRIFPPYFLLLAGWCLAAGLDGRPGMSWLMDPVFPLWPYLLYLQNFLMVARDAIGPLFVGITWSLAIEEQFYLVFPLLIRFAPARSLPAILVAGILSAPLLRLALAMLGHDWDAACNRLLFTRWDSLLLGALVAWLVRAPPALAWLTARKSLLWGALAGSGILAGLLPVLTLRGHPALAPFTAFGVYLVIAFFFAMVLLLLQLGWIPRTAAFLSCRLLCYFGRISYSVYLFHVAIMGLLFSLLRRGNPMLGGWQDFAVMAAAFLLTVGLAQATWMLFERRLIGFGHKFSYRAAPSRS